MFEQKLFLMSCRLVRRASLHSRSRCWCVWTSANCK